MYSSMPFNLKKSTRSLLETLVYPAAWELLIHHAILKISKNMKQVGMDSEIYLLQLSPQK
jgi:hypothetical protein